ncbi:MAG: methionyl-tRNA formyltransferase [Candidatus Latescibacterota bacterium]
MRIVFMGTSDFAAPSLKVLARCHDVVLAVTRCDSCRGRGLHSAPTPLKTAALELGIPVLEPLKLDEPGFISNLLETGADLFFVVAFRILPRAVFSIPPQGTVNLHSSLLPDYRGAAPINRAVINGDTETGVTTFYIDDKVDTGDIILTERIPIGPEETAGELAARMCKTGAELALRTVELIAEGKAPRIPQPMRGGRPAPKLSRQDGLIDWSNDARSIHNQVRGMNPCPGAYTLWSGGNLKIHRTRLADENSPGTPGLVAEASPREGLVVSCGRGKLRLLEVQPPGKKVMDSAAFVRGYRIETDKLI